jgi:prolyl oligopeptidase
MRADLSTPSPPDTWDVVIPEHSTDLLQWASALKGDALVVCWLRNVCSVLELRSLETGELVRDIPLPGLGSVASFSGELHPVYRVRRGNKTSPPGFSLAHSPSSPSLSPLSLPSSFR